MTAYVQKTENGCEVSAEDLSKALEKLAQYEALHAEMLRRQAEIPSQLEALRNTGKKTSVKFRELLGEKLMNNAFLSLLMAYGLEP